MSREFDVIVAGGGVVGATMAALLAAARLCAPARVALLVDAPAVSTDAPAVPADAPAVSAGAAAPPADAVDDWDLRVFALSRASERLLRHAGVWQRLPAARIFPYERMCVWDANGTAGGRGSLTFDCADIGEANLGVIADGRALQRHCLQAARDSGVAVIEASLAALDIGAAEVRVLLGDGRELRGGLLIAADGVNSAARTLLGIDTAGHSYEQSALVAHVRTENPHRNTAWQRFLPSGPLAFLPLPGQRSSIVWSVARAEAQRLRQLPPDGFGTELAAAAGGALGRCELTTAVASFPLRLQYALEYVRPRAVLLGDAAHVVHPLAGQGLNLGLMDCAALVETLAEAGDARRFGERRVLRRFERWRRSENLLAAAVLDGFERLFASSDPLLSRLRGAGLEAVGRMPSLKRRLAARALGLAGDVPAFVATGGPLSPRR